MILQNQNIITENLLLKVEKFKYHGVTAKNGIDIREKIKRRINVGKAYYYSIEKVLLSHMFSKN